MKETHYFSHDYNPSNDPKMSALIAEYGAFGYGIFWCITEMMHQEDTHKLPHKQYIYTAIAKQMQANAKQFQADAEQVESIIKHCILVCELFVSDGDFFYSHRVLRNFDKRAEISEKRSLAGKKGVIAKQNQASAKQNQASAKQILAKLSKEKESKEKENKVNKIKENIIPEYLSSVWPKYVEMRKKIKKPMTECSAQLALNKLSELSLDCNEQIKEERENVNSREITNNHTRSPSVSVSASVSSSESVFSEFWKLYPKKKDKGHAIKAWSKIKKPVETLEKIKKALEWQVASPDWKKEGGQFIPLPASYLNGLRWEDELPEPKRTERPLPQPAKKEEPLPEMGLIQIEIMKNWPRGKDDEFLPETVERDKWTKLYQILYRNDPKKTAFEKYNEAKALLGIKNG